MWNFLERIKVTSDHNHHSCGLQSNTALRKPFDVPKTRAGKRSRGGNLFQESLRDGQCEIPHGFTVQSRLNVPIIEMAVPE